MCDILLADLVQCISVFFKRASRRHYMPFMITRSGVAHDEGFLFTTKRSARVS